MSSSARHATYLRTPQQLPKTIPGHRNLSPDRTSCLVQLKIAEMPLSVLAIEE
jgi:hypothetical protein